MPNPFIISGRIERPEDFIGREGELRYIFGRLESVAQTGQPHSISVVGKRRIGKSSLLYHLGQVYTGRLSQPEAYLFAYLDLESAMCQALPGLLGAILETFLDQLEGRDKTTQKLQDRLRTMSSARCS